MKILLVDDNESWRTEFTEWLAEELGHRVTAVSDGYEALDVFREDQDFQVAIVDYSLPGGMDGIELLIELHQVSAELPVVLVTGYGERQVSKRALKNRAYWYLEKPVESTEVTALLGWLEKPESNKKSEALEAERESYLSLIDALEESNKRLSEVQKEEELHKIVELVVLSSFQISTFYLALLHKPTATIYFPVVVDDGEVKSLPPLSADAEKDSLTVAIINEGREIDEPDLERAEALPSEPRHEGRPARAFFGVPLTLSDERCIGALSIQKYRPGSFSAATRRGIRTLAQQVAFTLDRLTRLGLREGVLEELMAGKPLTDVLRRIAMALENAANARAVIITPLEAKTGRPIRNGVCSDQDIPEESVRWLQEEMLARYEEQEDGLTSVLALEGELAQALTGGQGPAFGCPEMLKTHPDGDSVGLLTVYYDASGGLSEVVKHEIGWFARRAALAIYLGQLLDQKRRSDNLHEVERQALRAASEDAGGRKRRVLNVEAAIREAWPEEQVDVYLLLADRGRRSLTWVKENGSPIAIRFGDKYCGQVAETGETMLIAGDATLDASAFLKPDSRSAICVPVKFGNSLLGVLTAESVQGKDFMDEDRQLLERVAEQLAMFIVTEGREGLREKVIGAAVKAAKDPKNALSIIVQSVHDIMRDTGGEPTSTTLCLVTEKGLEIVKTFPEVEFEGLTHTLGRFLPLEPIPGRPIGVAVRAVLEAKTQSVPDVRVDPDYQAYDPRTQAELAVPFYAADREKVLGVLNMEFQNPEGLTSENVRLVESLADQASVVAVLEQQSRELVEETFRRNQAMTLAMMGIEALARGHRLKNEAATVNLTLENLDVIVPRLVRAQSAWYSKLLRIFPGWEYSEKLVGELKRIGSALRLVEVSELTSRPERDQEIRIKKWAEDIANQWHTRFADETMTDLRQELSVSEEDRVMAAPGLLKRALDNLIDNAFRSARECPKPLVVFRVLQDEDNVRIEVEDNGKGFPESVSLFLFKSEIPEGTEGVKSMGLGCLLTGFIVRAYGGTVRFANLEAGRGAKVWVTLPRISKR